MPPVAEVAAEWVRGPAGRSFEDVSGAMAMHRLAIRTIWAWDEDFRRLGFRVVP